MTDTGDVAGGNSGNEGMVPDPTRSYYHKRVIEAIQQERRRQDAKWGQQRHSNSLWLTIAAEEFGEIAKAMLDNHDVNAETIQTAAVLVAWLEDHFERGEFAGEENHSV